MNFKTVSSRFLLASGGAFMAGLVLFQPGPSMAVGTVPDDVKQAIDNTTATIDALAPIALTAVAAALVPFGASLALSFVHKVMSKA